MTNALEEAEKCAAVMLDLLGVPIHDNPDLAETPARMVRALAEMTAGLRKGYDPARHLSRQFAPPPGDPQLVIMTGIEFRSMCEHHMVPFHGTATVGYLPAEGARVVGVSKLARIVEEYALRPQMQERLGHQIVSALDAELDTQGAGCVIDGVHLCVTDRGVRSPRARLVTSHLTGKFYDGVIRAEFLALARGS